MKKGKNPTPGQPLSWDSSLVVPSLVCHVGSPTFGFSLCQCSPEFKDPLGWNFPWRQLYLAEMFNKRLCREIYFIQRSVLSFRSALTLVEEVSSLSWWWFICSIKSSDKALVPSMGPEIRLSVKRQEWKFHLSCSDLNAEKLLWLLLCYLSSKGTEWGAELCHNCLGWNQQVVQAKKYFIVEFPSIFGKLLIHFSKATNFLSFNYNKTK